MNSVPPEKKSCLALQLMGFLKTPSLWKEKNSEFGLSQFTIRNISAPKKLEDGLKIPETLVLGKRVEYFFRYYIKNFSKENLLASNTVIRSGKITIGELDFLLENKESHKVSHVELIYKFYLYDPDFENEVDRWIGPNKKDTLVKKLDKLKNHQLPLLFRRETREFLSELGFPPEEIEQQVCFKANLFVPLPLLNRILPLINNDCVRGYWIRKEEFKEEYYSQFLFYSPTKANWPIEPEYWNEWYDFQEIKQQISVLLSAKKSPLIWMKVSNSKYLRFFLVWW